MDRLAATTRAHLRLLAAVLAAASLGLLSVAVLADAKRSSASTSCARASANPHAIAYSSARDATLCLINAERRKRGLRPLRHDSRLARAASRHARDMVRRRYFSHTSPGGSSFVDRIIRARYVRSRRGTWRLGENLAWGAGRRATPEAIVRAWMRSPGHRRNILNRHYRHIGISIVRRAPVRGKSRAATYVTEFGRR